MDYEKLDSIVTPIVFFIFFAAVAVFIVVSFILDHHWRRYSTSQMRLYFMRGAYLVVSGILLFVMATMIPFIF